MQMSASSVIHVAPTKTLEYEVRDKKIQAMDEVGSGSFVKATRAEVQLYSFINGLNKLCLQAGREIWSKELEVEWPEESVGPNSRYLVEYEPVGSVFEALVRKIPFSHSLINIHALW